MNIFDIFPGKKTYFVGIGMMLTSVLPIFQTGELAALDLQTFLTGLGLMTLRKGMKRGTGA